MPEPSRVLARLSLPSTVLVALALLASALPVLGQDGLSRGDRRWLEEVEPIMTAQERQIFETLPSRERNRFKEHFWARRSQNPHNPDPAEDAFESWREQADDQFGQRGQKGSRTDMALVMLLFGPPDNRERVGGRGGAPGGARPPAGRDRKQPGQRGRRSAGARAAPPAAGAAAWGWAAARAGA